MPFGQIAQLINADIVPILTGFCKETTMKTATYQTLIGTIALSAAVALAGPALAQGRGSGAGMGVSAGVGTSGMSASGTNSVGTHFGGDSSSHISTEGSLNTNGPNSKDRDFGLDRANDRANAHAALDTRTTTSRTRLTRATRTTRTSHSNGPTAIDRDYGYDRAKDEMNSKGSTHSQAQTHVNGTAGSGTIQR